MMFSTDLAICQLELACTAQLHNQADHGISKARQCMRIVFDSLRFFRANLVETCYVKSGYSNIQLPW